jgi:tRNA pseudouridine13 synthase
MHEQMNSPLLHAPAANMTRRPLGQIKQLPADFIVEEVLGLEPENEGEHLLLKIRKSQLNTENIAQALQKHFELSDVDVSYCGLKDKQAVTEQWFSVRTPRDQQDLPVALGDIEQMPAATWGVVCWQRHARKLRRGAHRRNRFTVRLRNLHSAEGNLVAPAEQIMENVDNLIKNGFPNYFGIQRFGSNGDNLRRAEQHFNNPRRKITRTQRGFCYSAARSALFNRVCAARVLDRTLSTPLPGEPMMLQGSRSYFVNDGSPEVTTRCNEFDIHPSGPLWGRGQSLCDEPHSASETKWLADYKNFRQGLENAGLKQERRALRAIAHDIQYRVEDDSTMVLQFELDKSVYATVLLQELLEPAESTTNSL